MRLSGTHFWMVHGMMYVQCSWYGVQTYYRYGWERRTFRPLTIEIEVGKGWDKDPKVWGEP